MLVRLIAGLLSCLLLAQPVLAAYGPSESFADMESVISCEERHRLIEESRKEDGTLNLELLKEKLYLALGAESGEEPTIWPWIVATIVASIAESCKDSSYRDKDRCIGNCKDYDKSDKRK